MKRKQNHIGQNKNVYRPICKELMGKRMKKQEILFASFHFANKEYITHGKTAGVRQFSDSVDEYTS